MRRCRRVARRQRLESLAEAGCTAMPGLTNVHEERVETPFGEPSGGVGALGERWRDEKWRFWRGMARGHRLLPIGDQLSREHLCDEGVWACGADSFGFGGGVAEGGA